MASNNNLMVRLLLNTQGFDTNIQKSSQQIRQFQVRVNEVGKNVEAFGNGLGINIGQLAKFGTAAGIAAAAGKVLSDAFMKNESNADAFNSALEQSKAAYSSFLNTINGGSWSNFFSNMEKAIKDARELYDLMDRAGTLKDFNDPIIAHYERLIAEARLKLKTQNLSKEEREQTQKNIQTWTNQKQTYQNQVVNAQKDAALKQMYTIIADRTRSMGVNVLEKDIRKWVNASLKGKAPYLKNTPKGYSFTDDMVRMSETLRAKGTVKLPYINAWGQREDKSVFKLNRLSKQEQLKYALATAFAEGEGELAIPRRMLAEVDREIAANLRGDARNLALVGRGGGTPKPDEPNQDKPKPDEIVYKEFTRKKLKEEFAKDFGDAVADSIDDDKIEQAYINLMKTIDKPFIKWKQGIISEEEYQRSRYNAYSSFAQSAVDIGTGHIELANAAIKYAGKISTMLKDSENTLNAFNSLSSDIDKFTEGLKSTDVDTLKASRTALEEAIGNYDKNSSVGASENLSIMLNTLKTIANEYDTVIAKQEAWNMKMNNFKNISTTLDVSANAVNSIGSAFKSAAIAAQQAGDVMKAKSLETTGFLFQATAQIAEMIAEVYKLCIVNGVASAAKLPYPANLVAIATMIGTISSMVAMGFSTFSNQKYASGGIVQGSGSGWSDSVPTLLSNGEMVLNRRQQGNLFALLDGNRISDSLSNGKVEFKISGQNLIGTLNNYNKKTSKIL